MVSAGRTTGNAKIFLIFLFFGIGSGQLEQMIKIEKILQNNCINDTKNSGIIDVYKNSTCKAGIGDYFTCWKQAKLGEVIYSKCKDLLFESGMTSRKCKMDGNWGHPNIRSCRKLSLQENQRRKAEFLLKHELETKKVLEEEKRNFELSLFLTELAFILRCLDGCTCLIGLAILSYLIPLKNIRFLLHRNLILTFLLGDISQILLSEYLSKQNARACSYFFFFVQYLFLCQIAWMSNEAFLHFRQFFFVFLKKNYIWVYFVFGYVFPAVVTFGIYVPIILSIPPIQNFSVCWESYNNYHINKIIYGTAYSLLILNFLIIFYIILVIWKNLQQRHETVKARKTARGFIILSVLLGGGYIGSLNGPQNSTAWEYFRTIVNPTQGTLICIFHVISTREVRKAAMKKLRIYMDQRQTFEKISDHSNTEFTHCKDRFKSIIKNPIIHFPSLNQKEVFHLQPNVLTTSNLEPCAIKTIVTIACTDISHEVNNIGSSEAPDTSDCDNVPSVNQHITHTIPTPQITTEIISSLKLPNTFNAQNNGLVNEAYNRNE